MPIQKKEATEFDKLADKLVTIETQIRKWEADAPKFEGYQDLIRDKEVLLSKIKDLAREQSVKGKTRTLIDTPSLLITVTGTQSQVEYDLDKAQKLWPQKVLDTVILRSIDSKRVEALLNNGDMSDALAEKAMHPRKAKTPAVSVKLFPERRM